MQLISKIIFLFFCIYAQLEAQEIIVVKTRSIPIVEQIISGFVPICSGKYQLTIFDMEGNLHKGHDILSQIQDKIEQQNIKAIFTIGLPATRLIKQSILDTPIVFTMVRNPENKGFMTKNLTGISIDLPPETQLQYLKKTLPHANRIAIIYSQKHSARKANQLAKVADKFKLTVNLYQVTSVKEIPKSLRRVITENDALILLPDKLILNQSSLEYFVTTVLENGFPTLGYNKYLVDSGILMGLSPNYSTIGQQAGNFLCSTKHSAPIIQKPEHFKFFVNSKTAKTIRMQLAPNLLKIADHVY